MTKIKDPKSPLLEAKEMQEKQNALTIDMLTKLYEKVQAKQEKYKSQGYADTDFKGDLRGKEVHMWLPKSVFDQEKWFSLANSIYTQERESPEVLADMKSKYYRFVCSHMHINNMTIDAAVLPLPELQGYGMRYWAELLLPLSLWGDTVVQEILS